MKKFLIALGFVALCGIAYAAVQITDGTANMGVTENIVFNGASVTATGAALSVNTLLSGQDVDTSLYTKAKGTSFAKVLCVNIDGTIYANSGTCY